MRGFVIVLRDQVHDAGVIHLRLGPPKFLGGHDFAGDLLDDLRPGDEHLRLVRLNDEIGQRRTVGRAARARSADQRDLRHRSGEHHVVVEDAPVAGEAVDAFLHARAAGIIDEDERAAGLQRHCIISAILSQWTSPAAPPATVKSWLARWTRRPSMVAHRSPRHRRAFPCRPCRNRWRDAWRRGRIPGSCPGSARRSTRSRAVSLPAACCLSMRSLPPPSCTLGAFRAECLQPSPRSSSFCSRGFRGHSVLLSAQLTDRCLRQARTCRVTRLSFPERPSR